MSRLAIVLTVTAVLAIVPDVVQSQQSDPAPQKAAAQRRRGDRNRLTSQDIVEGGQRIATAREVVRLLRPQWLQPVSGRMASGTMGGSGEESGQRTVIVYVDDVRQPDVEQALAQIPASQVFEIRYLDQNRAIQMRGPGHEGGVIEVTTIAKRP